MQDICTYHIKVRDKINETDFTALNEASPLQMTVARMDPAATLFTIYADQSGLVGLIRHLHRRGVVLLSVYRKQ